MSTWSGQFVSDELGVKLLDAPGNRISLKQLVGLALRDNPKRAHLLVSTVLGKHVPTNPQAVLGAGRLLGLLVCVKLDPSGLKFNDWLEPSSTSSLMDTLAFGTIDTIQHSNASRGLVQQLDAFRHNPPGSPIVLGYAETATALGAAVAQQLKAPYIHSTRYPTVGATVYGGFEESHSHATSHMLTPEGDLLDPPTPLVLVDDELSTGNTVLNTIKALHSKNRRAHYVVAALIDLRDAEAKEQFAKLEAELGVKIDTVALASGVVNLPDDLPAKARELAMRHLPDGGPVLREQAASERHFGFETPSPLASGVASTEQHEQVAAQLAAKLDEFESGEQVLVLGIEEDMYLPLVMASKINHGNVLFSTTTRSPVHPVNQPGYAVRSRLTYTVPDDDHPRFAHNLGNLETVVITVSSNEQYHQLCSPGSLLEQLRARARRLIILHALPATKTPLSAPQFGSYSSEDVRWLLKDLSNVELEASTEEREEAVQQGGAHYSESLPIEYQPSADYQQLFASALEDNAPRLAQATATVAELIRKRRKSPVLVSLARAGVPIGILIKRYLKQAHDLETPHYAVSIVRGRGIDEQALNYLAKNYDPADIIFVDGWTGKGAIVRELRQALQAYGEQAGIFFPNDLAVLADPGKCVDIYGTREDYLIPSACLNSTVSGLISRTVLRDDLILPGDYHGAKFYADLMSSDLSEVFLMRVGNHFAAAASTAEELLAQHAAAYTPADFSGWAAVEEISEEYGIHNVNLVKPGVGETTRVLLRRVPWKILIHPHRADELRHVRLLAEQRGVELEQVLDLPYSCIGLIHPQYTKGATGFDGAKA